MSRPPVAERLAAFYEKHLRKRPQQSRSRSVVEAILIAALEGMVRTGDEEALTVQDVAQRAGVGIGSLYDYFRDRESLLAVVAAKVTEDNLKAFEALLARTGEMSLRDAVAAIVDFALDTYLKDPRVPRSVLRIATGLGLMSMLAEGQRIFSDQLAAELEKRQDVHVRDIRHAAYVCTQSVMGLVQARIWEESPTTTLEEARGAMIDMVTVYLSGGTEARPT